MQNTIMGLGLPKDALDSSFEMFKWFGNMSATSVIKTLEHDFDKKKDGTGTTLGDSNYYIRIDRDLGADVNFITDDPSGINPTKVEFGIITKPMIFD